MNIRDEIVIKRRARLKREGHAQGVKLPLQRELPLSPFGISPFLICEVKRRSPSKGNIAAAMDAVSQASLYVKKGVKHISVLTEQDYFAGSIQDLVEIKRTFPEAAVLRKDFLIDEEDIEVSYRAGADAVLLIAALHARDRLQMLYRKAKSLGLAVLCEVHSREDVAKARVVQPDIVGINCRNLETFETDLLHPVRMQRYIDWQTILVFESGVKSEEDCQLAHSTGFTGILVGEAVVREPDRIDALLKTFSERSRADFWSKLYARKRDRRPLVKICGITRRADAECAQKLGADILGFIFAPSKRRVDFELLEGFNDLEILKVGVVVTDSEKAVRSISIAPQVTDLLNRGLLDAVQFHGDEKPEECFSRAFPYYKALSVSRREDIERAITYRCPRVLIDASSKAARGGTGTRIPADLVATAAKRMPLWLAGGLGPDNIGEIVREFEPEFIDASSRLESSPGQKDKGKLTAYFEEIERAIL